MTWYKKIAIIGGTGKVGQHLIAHAIEKGYAVRVLVRNRTRLAISDERLEVIEGEIQTPDRLRMLLDGCSVVINAFGQPAKEEPLYSKTTSDIFQVMEEYGVRRYIGVTGGSLTIPHDKKRWINRIGAKIFSIAYPKLIHDRTIEWEFMTRNKQIDWTLIRLPFVIDSLESKVIKNHSHDMPGTKITNIDIASYLIDQINKREYIHKAPFISH